jgi:hypothetical protein
MKQPNIGVRISGRAYQGVDLMYKQIHATISARVAGDLDDSIIWNAITGQVSRGLAPLHSVVREQARKDLTHDEP